MAVRRSEIVVTAAAASIGRSTSRNPVHMPGFVDNHNVAKWMWMWM